MAMSYWLVKFWYAVHVFQKVTENLSSAELEPNTYEVQDLKINYAQGAIRIKYLEIGSHIPQRILP